MQITMRRAMVVSAVFALAALVTGRARADLVYSNGPINGTSSAYLIDSSSRVSDSFTVAGPADLTDAAHVGLWLSPGSTPVSLDWEIGTTPFGSDVSSGTASVTSTPHNVNALGFTVYDASFALTGTVGVGTYYLTLTNATSSTTEPVYWDRNFGPSTAYQNSTSHSIPSESFQLDGTTLMTAVPEPSTLLPAAFGSLALGGYARRRRQPNRVS